MSKKNIVDVLVHAESGSITPYNEITARSPKVFPAQAELVKSDDGYAYKLIGAPNDQDTAESAAIVAGLKQRVDALEKEIARKDKQIKSLEAQVAASGKPAFKSSSDRTSKKSKPNSDDAEEALSQL